MPGFINAHHHSNGVPDSLIGIEDDFLELRLYAQNGGRQQDLTHQILLSSVALLKNGITTVVDVSTIGGSAEASQTHLQTQINAYEQASA